MAIVEFFIQFMELTVQFANKRLRDIISLVSSPIVSPNFILVVYINIILDFDLLFLLCDSEDLLISRVGNTRLG